MKTLIIYEEIPDGAKLFLVEGDRSDLQGLYVNMVDCEIPDDLMDQLCEPEKHFGPALPSAAHLIPEGPVIVVRCGFFL